MWTFLATEILFFGGMFMSYIVYRHAYPQAFAEASRHTIVRTSLKSIQQKRDAFFTKLFALVLLLLLATRPGVNGQQPKPELSSRLLLSADWQLQSSFLVRDDGTRISTTTFNPRQWFPAAVPTTVLGALVKNGVYPDLRLGLNAYRIPDADDEFNAKHDLAQFSHLPGQRNPWRDPWWYRKEFTLPKLAPDRRVWLHFDAINYRAAVWLNGQRIADTNVMAGMFQRFQFDITGVARPGANALAVQVYPVDHPGTPDTMWEPLGKDRGYVGRELMRDVTEFVSMPASRVVPLANVPNRRSHTIAAQP